MGYAEAGSRPRGPADAVNRRTFRTQRGVPTGPVPPPSGAPPGAPLGAPPGASPAPRHPGLADADTIHGGSGSAAGATPGSGFASPAPYVQSGHFGAIDVPEQVGRYAVAGVIGRGGMGVVYRAIDPSLRRDVAIKMIIGSGEGGAADPVDRERFLREARVCSRLQHPGIVRIHEVGTHAGRPYIAMDFIRGKSFEAALREERLSARRVAEVARAVAEALDHAHRHGVIHRDVKPHNILLDADGRPHLMDFGLAVDASSRQQITVSGDAIGTPAYMAPEQARGARAEQGAPTDVWGLGAVVYRALTGSTPFRGATPMIVMQNLLTEDPTPPRAIDPKIHPGIEAIVLHCLEKDPTHRYRSAGELAADLDRFLAGEPVHARAPGRLERLRRSASGHRLAALAVCAIVLSLLAVVGTAVSVSIEGRSRAAEVESIIAAAEAGELASAAAYEEAVFGLVALSGAATVERLAGVLDAVGADLRAVTADALLEAGRAGAAADGDRLEEAVARFVRVGTDDRLDPAAESLVRRAGLALLEAEGQGPRLRVPTPTEGSAEAATSAVRRSIFDAVQSVVARRQRERLGSERLLTARLCCDALARLDPAGAAEPLGGYLLAEADPGRAAAAGIALCLAEGERAEELLLGAVDRFDAAGPFWDEVSPYLDRSSAAPRLRRAIADASIERAELLFRDGRRNECVARIERALKLQPDHGDALALRGLVRCADGETASGRADLERAVDLSPDNARAWSGLAVAKERGGDLPGAMDDHHRALEIAPGRAPLWVRRAATRHRQGDLEGALDDLSRAIELDEGLAAAWRWRAIVRVKARDTGGALKDLDRALELDRDDVEARRQRGFVRLIEGDLDGGRADFELVLASRPPVAIVSLIQGALKGPTGNLSGAVSDFTRAIQLDPKLADAWRFRGFAHLEAGEIKEAIADLERAVKLDPNHCIAWDGLGGARRYAKDLPGAIEALDRSIALAPRATRAWRERGVARFQAGDYPGALADLDHCLELDPTFVEVWNDRGSVKMMAGDLRGSIADLTRALELDPASRMSLFNRGLAFEKAGRPQEAIADYRRFLRMAPMGDPYAESARRSIDALTGRGRQ